MVKLLKISDMNEVKQCGQLLTNGAEGFKAFFVQKTFLKKY